jgi:hypothetical protein
MLIVWHDIYGQVIMSNLGQYQISLLMSLYTVLLSLIEPYFTCATLDTNSMVMYCLTRRPIS